MVGDRLERGPVTVEVVPAVHKPGRGPHTKLSAEPVGYIIDTGQKRFYFAGDTDLFPEMADLDDIDVALLPIWGWGPSIGSGHLDPHRATEATRLIRPGLVVPIHWGTYAPEDGRRRLPQWFEEPTTLFGDELAAAGESERFELIEPGGSLICT
jgi:L-ascorbate metabolism protein UlaG (beta-lactamase superfamily)